MTVFVFNQHLIKHGRGCVNFTRLTSKRQLKKEQNAFCKKVELLLEMQYY